MTGIIKQLEVFQKFIEIDLLLFTLTWTSQNQTGKICNLGSWN